MYILTEKWSSFQRPITRNPGYSCNINRLSLVWDRLSTEIQSSSNSNHFPQYENTKSDNQIPPLSKTDTDLRLVQTPSLYGDSIAGKFSQGLMNNEGPQKSNSPSNCQSTLIQTSQNQCYIVVQLNLENTNSTLTRWRLRLQFV